jgi:hypothetical protein
MALTPEEARVLACLVEKETTVPDSYPLTLNSLRLACNQATNRNPVTSYDDRTVDNALLSLKSQGLVRFVHASHGARTTKYRHSADERWRLDRPELAVLSVLVLRGPQTAGELRSRAERQHPFADVTELEQALDNLAARTPDPFVVRLERRSGERDARWAHLLCGAPDPVRPGREESARPAPRETAGASASASADARLADVERRLARLEAALGIGDEEVE